MKFVIASFNICSAHFKIGRYTRENLEQLGEIIKNSGADVVAMQEVDKNTWRSEGVDMTEQLATLAGFKYHYFIKIRDFQDGEYGTAIISKFEIVSEQTYNYPVKIATQGTSCGYVELQVGDKIAKIYNTHLSVENEESNTETLMCLNEILERDFKQNNSGFLCCGDFNTNPDKINKYISVAKTSNNGLLTYADRSIDNILYSGNFNLSNVRTIDTTHDDVTDHNMLLCDVEF